MTAGAFCNRKVIVTGADTPIYEAAGLMREHHVGCLVVVEAGDVGDEPIGLVTDRDIVVEVIAQNINPDTLQTGDIMAADPICVHEDESLWNTIKRMSAHGIRRLPVIDNAGALVGLLAVDDLLDLLSVELSQLTTLFLREQKREMETRS